MTAKDKARELINKYFKESDLLYEDLTWTQAKECALIAVDEILSSRPLEPNDIDWNEQLWAYKYWYEAQKEEAAKYWQEVKQEIEKL
jgi:hypothetical protein